MAGIWEQVTKDLTVAMKARESVRVDALRLIRAEGIKKQKEKGGSDLNDEVMVQILKSMAKQRRESIQMFEQAGRTELVEKEKGQLEIVESYLPAAVDESVIDRIIDEVITESGAIGMKDMGKVMGLVMQRLKEVGGTVDGGVVNAKVKARLSSL